MSPLTFESPLPDHKWLIPKPEVIAAKERAEARADEVARALQELLDKLPRTTGPSEALRDAREALHEAANRTGEKPKDLAAKFYERVKDIPGVLRVELQKPSGPTIVTVVSGISDLANENRIYSEELKFMDDYPVSGGGYTFELRVEPPPTREKAGEPPKHHTACAFPELPCICNAGRPLGEPSK